MKLLVTGGAGFVGATVTRMLLDAGHEVVVVDDLSRNDDRQIPDGAKFIQLRVHDVVDVLTPRAGFDAVLHFAGLIAAGESMHHPEWHWDNNTRASLALLDAMRAADVGKLVFSSTAAVYGEPTELPLVETSPTSPVNTYGDTKLAIDRAITSFARASDSFGAISLRYFNVAGAHDCGDGTMIGERHNPETHLIPLALDTAMGRVDKFSLFGNDYPTPDGTCVRDYIHITDLARAHLLALGAIHPGEHKIYNLGNGIGFSNLQVIEAIREVTGEPFEVETAPRRPGDPAMLYASSELAHNELEWRPQKPDIVEIVRDAWRFHRQQ
ncbi:UDP-glucose 4-epimerase GalE [Nocardia sp. NBC_00508]|uniref:UDP-glucose 4-epimerase GalE n=1 Tax=Nocardia sp. NBC_00508 TaxID=2975992 RepID=UPI002E803877|nr:UDP-glucose 4-epimerase GalE [Nocardia sp. NBC_00508]WUD67022.1 UDP-glucose 4-epimerase GalE [Nocardia sp. NBC_00508]